MFLKRGTVLGHYEILSPLGSGGMGEVYRAKDLGLEREVAIKVLPEFHSQDKVASKRLEREAKTAASLSHPNILDIHDFGNHEGISYVVMELLEGRTLRAAIQSSKLSTKETMRIALSIAEGLHVAHTKGVIHRDLKPENIFLTSDDRVKILDFGLALWKPAVSQKYLDLVPTASVEMDASTVKGTVPYMSPEQLRGQPLDGRSDIFSFGCIVFEMMTGKPLFLRKTSADTVAAILHDDPEQDSRIDQAMPPILSGIVKSCVQKDPDRRIPDAKQLFSSLQKAITTTELPVIPTESMPRVARWKSAGLAAAILLMILLMSAYLWNRHSRESRSEVVESLAVLPLKNLSGNPQDDYFVDGVTEEITARLAAISKLRVISRTSAMQYKETQKSLKQIAKELNVDMVLEGSVRKQDDRIRLVANLIQADSDRHIWTQSFDRELNDILNLQNELAIAIASEIKTQLTPGEQNQLQKSTSIDPGAYDIYLKGLEQQRREDYSRDSLLLEIDLYSRAVARDPNFAKAYASLAQAHAMLQHFGFDPEGDHASKSKAAVDRALEIDPQLPEAHLALGYYYYWIKKDYDASLREFGMARKALPNNTEVLEGIAYVERRQWNVEAAVKELQKALRLSPRDLRIALELANSLSMMRKYPEANQYYDLAISLAPDQTFPYLYKADNYYLWQGNTKLARSTMERLPKSQDLSIEYDWLQLDLYSRDYRRALERLKAVDLDVFEDATYFETKEQLIALVYQLSGHPDQARSHYELAQPILEKKLEKQPEDPRVLSSLGLVYAGLGLKEKAIEKGKLGVELYKLSDDPINSMWRILDLAQIYTMTGESELALNQLESLLASPMFFSVARLRLDPRFESLHNQARFQKWTKQYAVASSAS